MHEVGIISSLVKTIEKMIQEEGMTEVQRVVLEVGELSGIVPEYLYDGSTLPGTEDYRNCGGADDHGKEVLFPRTFIYGCHRGRESGC